RNLQHLLEHGCDAAILAGALDRRLTGLPIGRASVEVIFPVSHRFHNAHGPLDVRELDGEPILVTSDEYMVTQILKAAARAVTLLSEIIIQSTVASALACMARAGLGVAVLSNSVPVDESGLAKRPLAGPDGTPL